MMHLCRLALACGVLLGVGACSDFAEVKPNPAPVRTVVRGDSAPKASEIPPNIANLPDAVVINEPKSKSGNPDSYEALGERYIPQKEAPAKGFFESGKASWYGKKFHGRRTATGETYDMFAMTAAHKTLRLPSYARITNLDNGKSCIVKVNDRGPFVKGRIVDVSYAAAAKLDMISTGHANVALEQLVPDPEQSNEMVVPQMPPRYLQAGLFTDPIDAVAIQQQIAQLGLNVGDLLQLAPEKPEAAPKLTLLVGPFTGFAEQEIARLKLERKGIRNTPYGN